MTTSRNNTIMSWMAYTDFLSRLRIAAGILLPLNTRTLLLYPGGRDCIGAAGVDAYLYPHTYLTLETWMPIAPLRRVSYDPPAPCFIRGPVRRSLPQHDSNGTFHNVPLRLSSPAFRPGRILIRGLDLTFPRTAATGTRRSALSCSRWRSRTAHRRCRR